ncbi:MAG TPA: tetratricopeptide repeat protein, partial [Pyrinomonadaceae bacterium]|nr:tetratricopeptide repeat protein [Pyrinomonadaceae bacterium]
SATTEVVAHKITGADLVDPEKKSNNLSRNYGHIIGREKEKAAVISMLAGGSTRLLTLTGIGGTGKTRLSQAVGLDVLPDFADGVFFVELSGVTQPDLVAATIASTLGIKDTGGRPVIELLKDHLRDRQMLLVIDNFEQVIDAGVHLAELLSECERLKILVTSRVLLHLSVEREMTVPPLTPPSDGSGSLEEIRSNDAIKLFVQRAVSAKPGFELNEANAATVGAICTKLEGLPLAIELAAARIKILNPEGILKRLEDRLSFLTGGPRDLPARQRTMHGAVDWSYELLTAAEKTLFRKLSVFAGGFRLDAAEALFPNDPYGGFGDVSVLDLVTSLVNQSLLIQRPEWHGEPRFQMLDVVRDFAAASLESAGQTDATRAEHAGYFLSLAERAEPFLQAARSAEWLDRLEEEDDNIRAAMQWSLENDPQNAVRLAVALRNFWLLHSHLGEGYRWLKAALECGGEPPAEMRFKLMNGLGLASRFRGDLDTARKAYENGLAAGKEAGDKQGIAVSSRGLGLVAMQQGDIAASEAYFESGLVISRELDDKFGIALSLSFLGDHARTRGDYKKARPFFEEALVRFSELDNKSAAADAMNNLAAAAFGLDDFPAAEFHFTQALTLANTLGNKMTISYSLDGFAALAVESGELERAGRLAAAADTLRESIGYKIEPAEMRFRESYLEKLRSAMRAEALEAATAAGNKLRPENAVAEALDRTQKQAGRELHESETVSN